MIVKNELHKLINIKNCLIFFVINLINDIISLILHNKIISIDKTIAYTYLFNRFYCTELNILQYAMYISILVFTNFLVINEIIKDNQKFGVFYLVRMPRYRYILSKIMSVYIFSIIVSIVIFLQSFATHRFWGVLVSFESYCANSLVYAFWILAGNFLGITIYALTKNSNISFLTTLIFFSSQSIIFIKKEFVIPQTFVDDKHYCLSIVMVLICIIVLTIKLLHNDFITTKIKE